MQAVCGRIIVLNNGRLIADSTAEHLGESLGNGSTLLLRAVGEEKDIQAALQSVKSVKRFSKTDADGDTKAYSLTLTPSESARSELFFAFSARKIPIVEMKSAEYSLEDIFISLVNQKDKK